MVCKTLICGSKIADWLSNDWDFLSESAAENEALAFAAFLEPFKLLEPFGLPRPDGVGGSGVELVIDEW